MSAWSAWPRAQPGAGRVVSWHPLNHYPSLGKRRSQGRSGGRTRKPNQNWTLGQGHQGSGCTQNPSKEGMEVGIEIGIEVGRGVNMKSFRLDIGEVWAFLQMKVVFVLVLFVGCRYETYCVCVL